MKSPVSIGLAHLAYKLPQTKLSLSDLVKNRKISSSRQNLKDFGFNYCYIHDNATTFHTLVLECGKRLLTDSKIDSKKVDYLFFYTGLNQPSDKGKSSKNILTSFRYPITRMGFELSLTNANMMKVSEQGCSGLLSTIFFASKILQASDSEYALCLTGDMLPKNSTREIMYNVMSDAAGAVMLSKRSIKNKIIEFYQITQPYYWDTPLHEREILASYFPMSEKAIQTCLKQAKMKIEDIRWFVPHNVSLRSWRILAEVLHIPKEKIWIKNISQKGHTVSSDHIINLVDMENEGSLKKGDHLFLFTFGFGASWSCMILQH